jgi:hypothetical protein
MARSTSSTAGPTSGNALANNGVPTHAEVPEGETVESLWAEVQRLRALVGPSEESYVALRLDVLGARDAAMGSEMELGEARALVRALGSEVDRLQRDHVWLRQAVIRRLIEFKGLLRSSPKRAAKRLVNR